MAVLLGPKALFGVLGLGPWRLMALPDFWRGFGHHDHGGFLGLMTLE